MTEEQAQPQVDFAAMAAAAAQAMKPKFLWTANNYWDQDGMHIEERVIKVGERPEGFPLYFVHAKVSTEVPMGRGPDGNLVMQNRDFPIHAPIIEATSLEQALEMAPAAIKKAADEFAVKFEEHKRRAEEQAKDRIAQGNLRRGMPPGVLLPGRRELPT